MKDLSIIVETKDDPSACIEAVRSIFDLADDMNVHVIDYSNVSNHTYLDAQLRDRDRVPRARSATLALHWKEHPGKYGSFRDLVAVDRVETPFVLFVNDSIRFRTSTRIKQVRTFLNSDTPRIVTFKILRDKEVLRHAGFFEFDRMRKIETVIGDAEIKSVNHSIMSKLATFSFSSKAEAIKIELAGRFFACKRELLDIPGGNGVPSLSWDHYLKDPAESFYSTAARKNIEVLYLKDVEVDMIDSRSFFEKMLDFGLSKIIGSQKYDLLGT